MMSCNARKAGQDYQWLQQPCWAAVTPVGQALAHALPPCLIFKPGINYEFQRLVGLQRLVLFALSKFLAQATSRDKSGSMAAPSTETLLAAAGCCAVPGQTPFACLPVSSPGPLACPCLAKRESSKLGMISELEAHGRSSLLEDYWEECTPKARGCGRCLSCSWRGSVDSLRDDFDPAW